MIARALSVQPKVVIARLEARDAQAGLPELDLPAFEEVVGFYEKWARHYADRAAFYQSLKRLSEEAASGEQVFLYQKLADVYYGFEYPPTIGEFVEKAHEMNAI